MKVYNEIRTDGAERRRVFLCSLAGAGAAAVLIVFVARQVAAWLF